MGNELENTTRDAQNSQPGGTSEVSVMGPTNNVQYVLYRPAPPNPYYAPAMQPYSPMFMPQQNMAFNF